LPQMIYSRHEPWVNDCLAMIVGRLLYAGSELSLSHQWKNTVLWELCGVSRPVDVEDHCYPESEIDLFGSNRDGKRGHEQICLGLLCNADGCAVGVEVFLGNTQDASTVVEKVKELQTQCGLKKVILVGDRGMVTQANVQALGTAEGLNLISALTHKQIVNLLERRVIKAGRFDEQKVVEVIDPENPHRRYELCRNPVGDASGLPQEG